jgi:hypothetical protein
MRLAKGMHELRPWGLEHAMVTAAFVGVMVVLIGLGLSAYAINIADGRDGWKLRGLSDRFHRGG